MDSQEAHRQVLLVSALQDVTSPAYKNLVNICRESEAASRRARERSGTVLVPFHLDEGDSAALESQFSVTLKLRPAEKRLTATARVAGLVFLIDDALYEHCSGPGRKILFIDGDLMTAVARGLNGKIIERTHALARLSSGYFREDEQLRNFSSIRHGSINRTADLMNRQLYEGGGENYYPKVRENGPRVNIIVINHFKTPAPPHQLAWLANCRGSVVYGAIFFQLEMLSSDCGDLRCFPGRFYIDREHDIITLVPAADATMSISHPYSAWRQIVTSNSITSCGKEYLCEKYKSVPGVIYYTLIPIGSDYEVSESLKTHFFDKSLLNVTRVRYPKVKLSDDGVPIGFSRGELLVSSGRFESSLNRLLNSANDIVKPAEAFSVLMDHNNTSVASLDYTSRPIRMDVGDENELAMALALYVNWTRHVMRGTFRVMLESIRAKYGVSDMSMYNFMLFSMTAWLNSYPVTGSYENEIPQSKVVDWYGNDFSVLIEDVDPWVEFEQVVGTGKESHGTDCRWLPIPPKPVSWIDSLYERAVKAVGLQAGNDIKRDLPGKSTAKKPTFNQVISNIMTKINRIDNSERIQVKLVDEDVKKMVRRDCELTDLKQDLLKKFSIEQGAVDEALPDMEIKCYQQNSDYEMIKIPVVDVEPVSAMLSDLEMCNKGPLERDVTDTGYRIAEVDIYKNTEGIMNINDAKRSIPKAKWVRKPKINAGVEGKRPASQAALVGAVFKRNVGVPANRGSVNLETFPTLVVDKVISTCYRDDWKSIVQKHINTGLWQANMPDIESFVANVDEKKVRNLLTDFFLRGIIDLERWMLMIKGKIKPGREPGATEKVDHSQTILYLENSSINAYFSAQMRRFKLCMQECLRPEVSVSAEHSDEEHEDWYNSLNGKRESYSKTYSYSVDIKCFDRAQDHVSNRIDLEWYKRHGLDQDTLDIWIRTHGAKKAVSMMFGIVLTITQQGLSGDWKTLMRNSIVNLTALVIGMEISREDVVTIDIKGDDADIEVAKPLSIADTVACMSTSFNMSAKFQTNTVRYMCKQFRLKIGDRWIFVADPWARTQSVNTPLWIGNHEDDLKERWISLVSELRHYDNGVAVDAVAEAAQQYYNTERPLYQMARALSKISTSYWEYSRLFLPAELVQ